PGAPRRGGDAPQPGRTVGGQSRAPAPPWADFRRVVSASRAGAGFSLCGTDSRPVSGETIRGRDAVDLRQGWVSCPYVSSHSMAVRTSHWTLSWWWWAAIPTPTPGSTRRGCPSDTAA